MSPRRWANASGFKWTSNFDILSPTVKQEQIISLAQQNHPRCEITSISHSIDFKVSKRKRKAIETIQPADKI